jgi:hypothetical protein
MRPLSGFACPDWHSFASLSLRFYKRVRSQGGRFITSLLSATTWTLLAYSGLDRYDIQTKLEEIAGLEQKMRKKIPGVLKSLEIYELI